MLSRGLRQNQIFSRNGRFRDFCVSISETSKTFHAYNMVGSTFDVRKFAWSVQYMRCSIRNNLRRDAMISFVQKLNDLLIKHKLDLVFGDSKKNICVNSYYTAISRPLFCLQDLS